VPINSKELASITNLKLPKSLDDDLDAPGEKLYWRNWPETFDFVLWMDSSGAQKPEFKQLRLLKSGSFFDIYRVVRP
jgi:hypothetical protein